MGNRPHDGRAKGESQDLPKATGKLLPFDFRERLFELSGAELHIWLAYFLHSNPEDIAWPGRELLQEETWRNQDVITQVRARLVTKGWLIRVGNKQPRKAGNRFDAPMYKVVIPPRSDVKPERKKRKHHGKFPPRSDVKPPHRLDVKPALRSDVTSERSITGSIKGSNTGAPSGAASPSVAGFGAAPSGSPRNEQKHKTSVEGGNGMGNVFSQKLLTITERQDEEIARFVPNIHERDAQYAAFHNSLRNTLKEPVADPVQALKQWMETAPRFFES